MVKKKEQKLLRKEDYNPIAWLFLIISWVLLAADYRVMTRFGELDLIPDSIGYLLLAVAGFMLGRRLKRMRAVGLLAAAALVVYLILFYPFTGWPLTGITLVLMALNMAFVCLICLTARDLTAIKGQVKSARRYHYYGPVYALLNLTMFLCGAVLPGLFVIAGWLLFVLSILILWMLCYCYKFLRIKTA